eukprot:6284650-Prymnesium_polylepis.1
MTVAVFNGFGPSVAQPVAVLIKAAQVGAVGDHLCGLALNRRQAAPCLLASTTVRAQSVPILHSALVNSDPSPPSSHSPSFVRSPAPETMQ